MHCTLTNILSLQQAQKRKLMNNYVYWIDLGSVPAPIPGWPNQASARSLMPSHPNWGAAHCGPATGDLALPPWRHDEPWSMNHETLRTWWMNWSFHGLITQLLQVLQWLIYHTIATDSDCFCFDACCPMLGASCLMMEAGRWTLDACCAWYLMHGWCFMSHRRLMASRSWLMGNGGRPIAKAMRASPAWSQNITQSIDQLIHWLINYLIN